MLITLRAILLVLFIAAPFGEQRSAADLRPSAIDYAFDAVLTCPLGDGVSHDGDTWTAGEDHAITAPEALGENA